MKRGILQFCGVNPVRITEIGMVKTSTAQKLEGWIRRIQELGMKEA
ncbi:hypothetical protein ACTID9_28235 [Brevibacillus fluminis]